MRPSVVVVHEVSSLWIRVESSAVTAVRYDAARREIQVRFEGGGTYAYGDADRRTFEALRTADSAGAFVNRVLKPGHACREL